MTHSVAPSATASASTSSAEPYSLPPNFKGLIQQYLAISIPTITFTTELVDLLDQAQVRLHSTRVKVVIRWWKQERASALAVYPKLNNAPDLIHRNVLQLPNTQEPSYVSSYHALDASSSAAQPTLPPVLSSSSSKHPQHHQNQQQQRQGRIRGQLKRLLGTKNKQHLHRTQQSPLDGTSKDTAAASSHQRHQQQQQRQEIQKGKGNLFKRIFSSKGPSTPRSRSAAAAPEQEERDGVAVSPSDPVRSASTNNNNNNNNHNHNNSSTYNNPTSTARDSKPLPDLPESALPSTVAYPLRSSLELFHQYVHNMSAVMLEIHICPDLVALATVPDMSELFSNLNGTFSGVFPFVAAVPSRIAHHASMAERMLGKRAILGMVVFQAWFQDTSDVADTSEDAESTSAGSPLSERLESLDDRLSSPPTHSIHKPHPQPHLVPHMPPLHASHPHPHPRPPFSQVQQHENQFRPQQHHHQRQPSQGEGLHQAQQNHPIYHPHHPRQHATNYTSHHPYAQEQPQTFQQPVLYPDQQQQQQQQQQQHQYASSSYQKYPHPHQPHHAYPAQNPTHQSQIPPLQPACRNAHQGPEPPPPSSQNTMLPQQRLLPPGTRPGRIQIPVPQVESSPMNAGTNTAPLSSSSKDAPLRHVRQRSTMDDYARLAAYEPRMSAETNRTTPSSRSRPRSDATATAIGRLGTLLMRGEQLMQGIKTSFDLDPEEVRVREDSAQQRLRGRASHGEIQSRTPIASTPRQSRPVSFPPDSSSWIASNNNNNKDPVPYWPNHSRFTLEVSVCTAYLTSRSLLKRSKSSRLSLPSKSTACVPPKPLPSSTAAATTTTVTTKKSGAPFSKSPLPLPPSSQPPHHHHHQQEEDSNEAHQQQDMQLQQPSRTPRYRESLDDRGRTSTTLAPAEVSGPFDQTLWSLRRSETDGVLSLTALKRAQEGEEDSGDNDNAPRSPVKHQTDPYPLPQQQPLGSPAALPSSSLSSSRPPHATHPPRRQLRRSGPPIRPLSVSLTMPAFSQFLQQQRQNLSLPSQRQASKTDVATTGYQSFGPVPDQPDATATVPSSSAVVPRRQHHQLESLSGMRDEAASERGAAAPASSLTPSAFVPVLSTASREPLHDEPDSDEDYGHHHHHQRHRQHQPPSASTTAATTRPPVHHRDTEQQPLSPAERRRELARREERKDEYQRQRELLNRAHPVPRQRHRRKRLDSQDRLQIRMNPTQIAKLGQLPPDVFPARTESHLIVPALLSGSSSSGSSGTNSEVSSVYGGGAGGASTGAGETDGWQHHQSSSRHQQLSNQRRRMFGGESGAMAEDDEELMARRRRQGLKGKGRADNGGMSMRSTYDPEMTTSRRSRESFSSKHLRQKQQQAAAAAAAGVSGTTSRLRAKGSASYHHPPRHRRDHSNTSGSMSDYLTRSNRSMSESSAYGYDSFEEEFPQPLSHARMQHHHRREASMAEHVLPQPSPFRRGQSSQSSSRWHAAGQEASLPSSSTRAPRSMATKKSNKAKSKTAKKRTHPQRFDFVAKTNVLLTPETMATLMMRRLAVEVWKVNQRTKEATDLGVAKVPLSKLIREIMQKMQEQQQQQQQQQLLQDSSSLSPTQSWASAPWKTHSRRGDSQHSQYFTHSRQSSMHHLHSNPHAYPYAQEQQGDPKRPQHSNHRHHYGHEGAGYGNSGAPSSRHLQTQASFSGTSYSARRAPVPEIATTSKYGSTLMATPFFPLEDDHHRRQRQQHYQRQQYQQQQQQQQQQRSSTPHLNRRPTLWELGPRMYRIHSRRGTVIGHLEAVVKMRPRGDSQSDVSVFSRAA